MSVEGKKVLHMDRNGYYGGESTSMTLQQLFDVHKEGAKPPAEMGAMRDWNIDLVPKLITSCGNLVNILLKTKVTTYLDFKAVEGCYVYREKKIHKVPASDTEALSSGLMGFFEKRRCRKFFMFVADYDLANPKTHNKYDLKAVPMSKLYYDYGLDSNTQVRVALVSKGAFLNTLRTALPTRRAILPTFARSPVHSSCLSSSARARVPSGTLPALTRAGIRRPLPGLRTG